jgi:hypothetical protein
MDSAVGFQVIMRVANRGRTEYAMEQVRIGFDPSAPSGSPRSKSLVLIDAKAVAEQVHATPLRFTEFQRKYCCIGTEQWLDGRGSPLLSNALDGVGAGEIIREPTLSEFSFVIARRLEPEVRNPRVPLFELPKPMAPNIARKISTWNSQAIDAQFRVIERKAEAALNLNGARKAAFVRLHQVADKFPAELSPDGKSAVFENLLDQIRRLLGDGQYGTYLDIMNAHFEELIFAGH